MTSSRSRSRSNSDATRAIQDLWNSEMSGQKAPPGSGCTGKSRSPNRSMAVAAWAKASPERLGGLLVEKLKERVLTEENLRELVKLVNKELDLVSHEYQGRLKVVDKEVADVQYRLDRLYDALETGKLALDDLYTWDSAAAAPSGPVAGGQV